jgi:hypothetical protein
VSKALWTLLVLISVGCTTPLQKPFEEIQNTTDPEYGYSANNPIRIGHYGDPRKATNACYYFMSHLRTIDGSALELISGGSIPDPEHKPSRPTFLGIPMRGSLPSGGILDVYTLVPVGTSDTLELYFDIYHKERILVPKGLVFVEPPKATSDSDH